MTISYVFPNTSEIRQRGGLDERWKLAEAADCSFVQVPGDLIKKESEVSLTGQEFCTFLTKSSIEKLYKSSQNHSGKIQYILHTDPALNKQVRLRWNDPVWVEQFTRMILDISDFLGTAPAKVEIHPGDRKNSFADIVRSVHVIQESNDDSFGHIPGILLENRTGQFISQGKQIVGLWDFVMQHDPDLANSFGIVLDIQQLFTVTKENFLPSFNMIPEDCLKGVHIHRLHRPPKIGDGIPWQEVFAKISAINHDLIINPEIHHNNRVADVIAFCENLMKRV